MNSSKKVYLGDSVYADVDGEYIKLTTENVWEKPSNIIYLEPEVVKNLLTYLSDIK